MNRVFDLLVARLKNKNTPLQYFRLMDYYKDRLKYASLEDYDELAKLWREAFITTFNATITKAEETKKKVLKKTTDNDKKKDVTDIKLAKATSSKSKPKVDVDDEWV